MQCIILSPPPQTKPALASHPEPVLSNRGGGLQRGDARDLNHQSGVCLIGDGRPGELQTRGGRDGRRRFVSATAAIVARQTRARRGPLGQYGAPRREWRGRCQHGAARAGSTVGTDG